MLLPLTTPLLTPTDLEDVGLCVFFLEVRWVIFKKKINGGFCDSYLF
jgi:hypothetical protein